MINTSINLFEKKNQRHCCEIAVIAIILFYREIGNNKSTVTTEIFYKLDSIWPTDFPKRFMKEKAFDFRLSKMGYFVCETLKFRSF